MTRLGEIEVERRRVKRLYVLGVFKRQRKAEVLGGEQGSQKAGFGLEIGCPKGEKVGWLG